MAVATDEMSNEDRGLPVRRIRHRPLLAGVLAVCAMVLLPLVALAWIAASGTGDDWPHLAANVLPTATTTTIALIFMVSVGTAVIGVAAAWLVVGFDFPLRQAFSWLLVLPLAVPPYLAAYAFGEFFLFTGPVQSFYRAAFGFQTPKDYWFPDLRSTPGAAFTLVCVLYPYVYLTSRAVFLMQGRNIADAARTLGASSSRVFWTVLLPVARPAIAAGIALALMETLNDFGTVHYFAVDTFATGIYRTWMGMGQPAVAAQLGALLMVFVLALILVERRSRGAAKAHHTTNRYRSLPRIRLTGLRGVAALMFCIAPILLGFVLPGGMLAAWAATSAASFTDFPSLARNSLLLAGGAGAAAVAMALVLAYAQRMHPTPLVKGAVRLASLGYAIPGSVIAVGTLVPLTTFDKAFAAFMERSFGISPGLLLTGSVFALIYAYLVRFLAISTNTVEASLQKVTPSMEAAARTLGLGTVATLRRVHVPMVRGSLLSAALLVFVDVMKELPATLIIRPFNFDTLATRTFTLASDERLADAAMPALAIVLVGLVPVVLLSRAITRSRPGESA